MNRGWTLPLALAAALVAGPARAAADPDEKAGHAHGDSSTAIYEGGYHDEHGHHHHGSFDMSRPDDRAKLSELLQRGHIAELENKSAPTLEKMFSLKADLGIWSLIIFGIVLFILSKFAWPKMITGLQRRESNIRGALDEAENARTEAQLLRAALQKEMDQAHEKVKGILDQSRKDAQVAADAITAKARGEMSAERERLHREIQTATDQALQQLWTKAADLATELSTMALKKQLDVNAHRRLIDEALQDVRKVAGANVHAS